MTIMINREITTLAKAEAVEKALKEFKDIYNEEDLLSMFRRFAHMNNINGDFYGEILKTEVVGFQTSIYSDDISAQIEIYVLNCCSTFHRIVFFMEQNKESGWWDICKNKKFARVETYMYNN